MPERMLVSQRLRAVVKCGKCEKPRGIYAQIQLTTDEQGELERLIESVEYTCGSSLAVDGNPLYGKVFMQTRLHCSDHIEFAYYACSCKQPDLCCHCGSVNCMHDPDLLQNFKVVLPKCENCKERLTPTRQPRKRH